jgi:hypothetical protein
MRSELRGNSLVTDEKSLDEPYEIQSFIAIEMRGTPYGFTNNHI